MGGIRSRRTTFRSWISTTGLIYKFARHAGKPTVRQQPAAYVEQLVPVERRRLIGGMATVQLLRVGSKPRRFNRTTSLMKLRERSQRRLELVG